jgi:hypothetical protein
MEAANHIHDVVSIKLSTSIYCPYEVNVCLVEAGGYLKLDMLNPG